MVLIQKYITKIPDNALDNAMINIGKYDLLTELFYHNIL